MLRHNTYTKAQSHLLHAADGVAALELQVLGRGRSPLGSGAGVLVEVCTHAHAYILESMHSNADCTQGKSLSTPQEQRRHMKQLAACKKCRVRPCGRGLPPHPANTTHHTPIDSTPPPTRTDQRALEHPRAENRHADGGEGELAVADGLAPPGNGVSAADLRHHKLRTVSATHVD